MKTSALEQRLVNRILKKKKKTLLFSSGTVIPPNHIKRLETQAEQTYKDIFLDSSSRQKEGEESCTPRTISHINEIGITQVPLINLTVRNIIIKRNKIIARAWTCAQNVENMHGEQILQFQNHEYEPIQLSDFKIGPVAT